MTTTAPTTAARTHTLATTLRKAAARIIADELENDGNPYETAGQIRAAIRTAWAAALDDTGMDEDHAADFHFPI